MKRLFVIWGLGLALLPAEILAQGEPIPQRLYLNPGILIGSSRQISMAGAYVGVAEGASALSSSLATIAHRTPSENGVWSASPVFTYMWQGGEYDFDNDGAPDDVNLSGQYLAGLQIRYRQFGIGAFTRTNHLQFCFTEACEPTNKIELLVMNPSVAVAGAFFEESVVVAAGLQFSLGTIENQYNFWNYGGLGPEAALLIRPKGMPFRVGANWRGAIESSWSRAEGQDVFVMGRQIYAAFASPQVLSLGLSFMIGEGAFSYNMLPDMEKPPASRSLDARNPLLDAIKDRPDLLRGRLLVSLQADLIGGVEGAVPIGVFTRSGGQQPVEIGTASAWMPRIGLEHLTLPGRLRLRAGAYLEPSPFLDTRPRLHITAGYEFFLFRFIDDWAITGTLDAANHYLNYGFSIGFWR